MTEIKERGTTRVWKSWDYATANNQAGTWSNGKLASASRHNRLTSPATGGAAEPIVTESYEYSGVGGRISKVTTDVAVGGSPRFVYDLAYDPLGNVTSRTYPRCSHSFCSQADLDRTVTGTYTQGMLTAVPVYASSLTYHPNGLVNQVTHTNGVLELQERDPNDMARPLRLRTSGASEDFDTGLYDFDGAGNVTKMGSFRFAYDLLSRVGQARMEVPWEGCGLELLLDSGTETGTRIHESCGTVRAEGSYGVGPTGDVTLRAGKRVVLGDGFSVASGGRLTAGTDPALDPEGEPTDASQSFSYDRFGNLLTVTTERESQSPETRTIGTNASTNRLTVAAYDLSGNVTGWAGREYQYDPFNMLWQTKPTNGNGHTFVYGPGDERLWTIDWTAGTAAANWVETWTLRDLGGSPLRQYRSIGGNVSGAWSLQRDYVYRSGGLLAAHTPQGLQHFHLDHLGSPRIITDSTGHTLANHLYFPFGEEATNPEQDDEALKFTGHERDDLDSGGTTADLDYMHARHYSAHLGKFLSIDKVPVIRRAMKTPQRWNLYTYVASNPLKYVDLTGNVIVVVNADLKIKAEEELKALQEAFIEAGAENEAKLLQLEVVNSEVRITSGGVDLSESANPTVALIGSAINTDTRVNLQITDRDLSKHGGALTESVGPRDDPNRINISINPSQLSSSVVTGRVAAGPLMGTSVGLTYSTGTALVHEFGHAYGYYAEGHSRYPVWGQTNASALRYENLHRELMADPRNPLLSRHSVKRIRH